LKDFLGDGFYVFQENYFNWGLKRMNRFGEFGFSSEETRFSFGELTGFQNRNRFIVETVNLRKISLKKRHTIDYLSFLQPHIPKGLISSDTYTEMQHLASSFKGPITSFFGFETKLNSREARADYLFAVSSLKNERETLFTLIKNKSLPEEFTKRPEWQNISDFIREWTNPQSILYHHILGMWFEFDMTESPSEPIVPCIFLHTIPLRIRPEEDKDKIRWLTQQALPLITGEKISDKIENNVHRVIQHLPDNALVMDAGVMLSRQNPAIRLIVTKIHPHHIIPYLEKIGWSDQHDTFLLLLKELEQQVTRLVLHITVTENGIDQKIGVECSFASDRYHLETRWGAFFDYLIKKGLCLEEKKDALLQFMGIEQEDTQNKFDTTRYQPSVKIKNDDFSSALVRYISHIKLVYEPNHMLIAKAYPGIRLLGCENPSSFDM
jgi:hypothetical protein